jgi:DNA-directed RNA polymerase subunit M/transcription elongation factor TFIIS
MSEWKTLPTCPHCGTEDEYWWDGSKLRNDGDEEDCNCQSCLGKYRVTMCVDVSFRSKPKEAGDE